MEVETRKVTDLLPGSRRYFGLQDGEGDYDVSPDGKTLVFAANRTEPPYRTLDVDLFAVSTEGGPPRDLTSDNPASDSGPRFSPDGKRLAYGLERKADDWPDYTRLAVMDVATGHTTVLTEAWDNSAAGGEPKRRAEREGGACPARLLSRREPLGPEGPELEALVRRGAGLARALAEVK
ncbi:MAG: hypothetical protein DMF79_05735 [Acidobacteria bacterium]|nr:MAG: hypothetical protein DMF79_05735 [Acidobacteriota bacterium]